MAHLQQLHFFKNLKKYYPEFFQGVRVAEIGSLNINGSIRDCFTSEEYTGFDVSAGKGVDEVQQGQLITLPSGYYDVTASAECFEHNPFWVETFANMLRLTKPGGLVIFSCATTGRQEHGTSRTDPNDSPLTAELGWNYYRNLNAQDFLDTFNLPGWFDCFHFLVCPQTFDLYFYAVRTQLNETFDEQRFVNGVSPFEQEMYQLTNSVRIGVWTSKIGWNPR